MQLRCNYHLSEWAEWHCPHCGKDFCRQCVPAGHDYKLRAGGPKCALCMNKLEFLGSSVGAPNPAQQFITNLLFPFHINSLIIFIPLTLATIPFILMLKTVLVAFTILPLFFIFTFIIEYAGSIMLARSEGEKVPPEWGKVFKKLDMLYLIKHVATVGAGIGITQFCLEINQVFGFFIGALCLFILPAALMILAIDRSISRAMNPLLLLSMVRPFLKDYCIFYALALALAVFFWTSFTHLLEANAGLGLSLLWYLGVVAAIYACYAMLGYLMFYYQYDLGNCFAIDRGPSLVKPDYEILRALGDSDVLIAESRFDDARQVLRSTMNSVDKHLEVHQRYQQVLLQLDDAEALTNHSNFYIELLLENKDIKAASQSYRTVKKRMPEYLPSSADIRLQLAIQLKNELDPKAAIGLLRSFHEVFPNSNSTPQAYLLAAEILHQDLGDSHRAAVLLKFVLDNHPGDALCPSVQSYLEEVKKHF